MLLDRNAERAALDRLLAAVRTGESAALVLRGEVGIGKTALLDHVAAEATGCHVVRASGVEAEQELAFAALHLICAPMLDRLTQLPGPQRTALRTAFGMNGGSPPPDPFMVGLAVLGLLADLGRDQPVVCLIDDAQWLDRASAQVLGFAARRLRAESLAIVLATRGCTDTDHSDFAGLPTLRVQSLPDVEARKLLATSTLIGPIDGPVLDRVVAESYGNPLALLELPRGFTPAELAGGFGLLSGAALPRRIEESYRRQMATLTPSAQQVLLVAAAEPTGDPVLVWRAVDRLGIESDGAIATALAQAGFVEFDARVRFRHPLLRSAVYHGATGAQRRRVHAALAEVIDQVTDPDRRAWQRALAICGLDEEVAAELEERAGQARARGGPAAAAAFLERAAELTSDPQRRGRRFLGAAWAKHMAGMPHAGLRLVSLADAGPLDELSHARADLLRARIAFAVDSGHDVPGLLLRAAARLRPIDPPLARTTYLEAMRAAWYATDQAGSATLRDVAEAATPAPATVTPPRPSDLLLEGLTVRYTKGFAAGVPMLKPVLRAFHDPQLSPDDARRWSWFACSVAADLCDDVAADELTANFLRSAREAGDMAALPLALIERIIMLVLTGDLADATALADELENVGQSTGTRWSAYATQLLTASAGQQERTAELVRVDGNAAGRRGEGISPITSGWAWAVLCNGTGRFEEALEAARKATSSSQELGILTWAPLAELVVAAARTGRADTAAEALERLTSMTQACGTDWALGVEAYCRALLSDRDSAESAFREAIERLERTRIRSHLARAVLYFGEWLWHAGRHSSAREQLRTAHEMFTAMGMDAFAALAAVRVGPTSRRRAEDSSGQLTAQETQIVKLTRDGLSNVEIAARLFISPRTVEWHLSKIFNKLGIISRRQLRRAGTPGSTTGGTGALPWG
ncbi:AAA family ATPase [Actinoplanes sp. NPDC049596]|uniref:ATP-binding protein n=1 Tax=unclassified Actinoplanes TaxID=2626549 RepID=UPI0034292869